jgi:hypothetical protein
MPRLNVPDKNHERDWLAEDDMRTLAMAEEIKADRNRMQRAKKAGKRLVVEKKKEAQAMEQAVRKVPKKNSKPVRKKNSKPVRKNK